MTVHKSLYDMCPERMDTPIDQRLYDCTRYSVGGALTIGPVYDQILDSLAPASRWRIATVLRDELLR